MKHVISKITVNELTHDQLALTLLDLGLAILISIDFPLMM